MSQADEMQNKWDIYRDQIQKDIQNLMNQKSQTSNFKQYCLFCQKMLHAPEQYMRKSQKQSKQTTSQTAYNILTTFTTKFNLPQSMQNRNREQDRKRQINQQQAGRRILGKIKASWNYYFRLIQGAKNHNKQEYHPVYNQENIQMAKEDIRNMLKELKNTQGIDEMERERKEVDQEMALIKILNKMIVTQTEKVVHKKINNKRSKVQMEEQVVVKKQEEKPKKRVSQVIDMKGYFDNRLKVLREESFKGFYKGNDQISINQSKRQFNGAVLRYYMTTHE